MPKIKWIRSYLKLVLPDIWKGKAWQEWFVKTARDNRPTKKTKINLEEVKKLISSGSTTNTNAANLKKWSPSRDWQLIIIFITAIIIIVWILNSVAFRNSGVECSTKWKSIAITPKAWHQNEYNFSQYFTFTKTMFLYYQTSNITTANSTKQKILTIHFAIGIFYHPPVPNIFPFRTQYFPVSFAIKVYLKNSHFGYQKAFRMAGIQNGTQKANLSGVRNDSFFR